MRSVVPLLLVGGMLPLFGGCSRESEYTLEGSVSLDGQLIEDGTIVFEPAEAGARPVSAVIRGGSYVLRGVVGGVNTVSIDGFESQPVSPARNDAYPGSRNETRRSVVPAKYNLESELRYTAVGSKKGVDFALSSR